MPAPIRFAVALAALVAAAPAWAQIYKWVDDHGVVNYSSRPPLDRKASELDLSAATVSVYEAEKPDRRTAAVARSEVASLSDKIERLQRELEAERRARQYAAADTRSSDANYDQCVAERRVDCNGIYNGSYPYGPIVLLAPRPRRFQSAPTFPVTMGNVTAGNLAVGNNVTAGNFTTFSSPRPVARARSRQSLDASSNTWGGGRQR
ncbi:MAG: DUF4124 domain-containing protein [Burkholderiales bacterium]